MRRPAMALLAAALVACDTGPDARTIPVNVYWMEWPEEVPPDAPFDVRVVVNEPCALERRFRPNAHVSSAALVFNPYFLASRAEIACLVAQALDTIIAAPGLEGASPPTDPRVYVLMADAPSRAVFGVAASPPARTPPELPPAVFGAVTVRLDLTFGPAGPRTRAGGQASVGDDAEGCPRVVPEGMAGAGYPLANPDVIALPFTGFVRGWLEFATEPLCGEPRVFFVDEEPPPLPPTAGLQP